ncbi:MAG: alternative ribosome rescue aminoacyl-tRNA hydrolase ArfB [Actinocatenispora sp.]
MTSPLPVNGSIAIPATELRWRFSRSGGPGGQSVNTADSRVELSWSPGTSRALPPALKERALDRLDSRLVDGAVTITASEHRAQLDNRRAAAERLAALVREAIAPPPKPRRATRPSRGAVARRLSSKRQRSELKRQRRNTGD